MSVRERWERFAPLPADVRERLAGLTPLFERAGVRLAYLFGSLCREGQGQDVDLAILAPGVVVEDLRWPIAEALGTERLDLVDLATAPPLLRFEVIRAACPLYAVDETDRLEYEIYTLHEFRDTAYLRRQQQRILKERFRA